MTCRRGRCRRFSSATVVALAVLAGCASAQSATPPVSPTPPTPDAAGLAHPRVADPDPNRSRYDRTTWQPHGWIDADANCLDTRQEVLVSESRIPVRKSARGCTVLAGEWVDPYTGTVSATADRLQVDHLVALSDASQSGGWAWPQSRKVAFANDLSDSDELNAVVSAENERKADYGPDRWLPDAPARCWYVSAYARIKERWGLTVTPAQWAAIERVWSSCVPAAP